VVAVLERELVTTALKTWLAAELNRGVGIGESPASSPLPYVIVYPTPGGGFSGPFLAPDADVEAVYQLTSVAKGREQAEWLADKARHVVLDRSGTGAFVKAFPAIAGWVVYDRSPDSGPPPVAPDGAGLWRVDERFVFRITPA
jgi:hypothetical protein